MKLLGSSVTLALVLPFSAFAADHTGIYTCENANVTITVDLEDNGRSHTLSIENKRKADGVVLREMSGAAFKSVLAEPSLTAYVLGNQRISFRADGVIDFNSSITCTKN